MNMEVPRMNQVDLSREVRLIIPARKDYVLVASMTLCGLGMSAGLDMELLGDLRTVTCECVDCLLNQAGRPEQIQVSARVEAGRLHVGFLARERNRTQAGDSLDLDITRGVLETLMPEVQLEQDGDGVYGIECSMPV